MRFKASALGHAFSLLIAASVSLAQSPAWATDTYATDTHATDPHAHMAATGVTPAEAHHRLVEGNQRFVGGRSAHAHQDAHHRSELASGQAPHTIVLSCSDSRVPPELVFDQGLGDLFVVRVAGNILGAPGVASIEYAVEHLGARLIVVMGHESCGAVKAALNTPKGTSAGSSDLDTLVAQIQPNIAGYRAPASGEGSDKTLREPVKSNVNGVVKMLTRRSTIVRKAIEAGRVQIVPAIYSLSSGKVEFWGTEGL